jgi:membrane-associated phospholipid phosphatase
VTKIFKALKSLFFYKGDPSKVREARFSFPSGHSSFAWFTMTFLIVFVEARLQLLKLRYIKPLIQMAAFIAAYVTAISRIPDYHHRGKNLITYFKFIHVNALKL